jgi:hypothetical protein
LVKLKEGSQNPNGGIEIQTITFNDHVDIVLIACTKKRVGEFSFNIIHTRLKGKYPEENWKFTVH